MLESESSIYQNISKYGYIRLLGLGWKVRFPEMSENIKTKY